MMSLVRSRYEEEEGKREERRERESRVELRGEKRGWRHVEDAYIDGNSPRWSEFELSGGGLFWLV